MVGNVIVELHFGARNLQFNIFWRSLHVFYWALPCSLQTWSDGTDETTDSLLKHKPLWAAYSPNLTKDKKKKREIKKKGDLYRTYGTRVIPV